MIARDFQLPERNLICLIDYHTGLGPYGYGEFMIDYAPDSTGDRLAEMRGLAIRSQTIS